MSRSIHPTAVVDASANLGDDVEIGAHCYVGPDVTLGARTTLMNGACVYGPSTLGTDNVLFPHAVLGSAPQDLTFRGEATRLEVGDGNHFREYVTANRGTVKGGGLTRIGDRNLFMACTHLAHDCIFGSDAIVANNVLFAGHVLVEDGVVINGAAAFHHFTTIGRLAYVGGMSRVVHDVPPFLKVEGDPGRVRAVNAEGMRRKGLSQELIGEVQSLFRHIYRGGQPIQKALEELSSETFSAEATHLLESIRRSMVNNKGRHLESLRSDRRPSTSEGGSPPKEASP